MSILKTGYLPEKKPRPEKNRSDRTNRTYKTKEGIMKDTLKRLLFLTLAALAAVILFRIGYKIVQGMQKTKELVYDVAGMPLKKQTVTQSIRFSGVVEGDPQVKVYPIINGKFEKNAVSEGQAVNKNDVIAYMSRDEIGTYELVTVKSPISGMVIRTYFRDKGEFVSPRMAVAEIGNPESVKIVIPAGAGELLKIKKGQQVKITLPQDENAIIDGAVEKVSTSVSRENPAGQVIIKAGNKDKKLMIGSGVGIEVVLGQADVYLVPERAVLLGQDRAYIFVNNKGVAKEVDVVTGGLHGRDIEISGAFADGDEAVIKGAFKLYDGAKINFRTEK
jgi:multidrug efflux pump subunit AcrA (membrane-fusion protein)